ncbi:MAG: PAS domain S-box protein, partial [Proteobacteria bacterium]|nr:PAS domain S-box protein [Pseudomonadota bacterium]
MKNEDNPTVHNFPESDASRQKVAASQDLPQSGRQQYGAKELTALHSFSQAVSASLSPDVIIKRALDEIVGQVAPDVTLVFMRDGEQLVLKGLASSDPTYQPKIDVHRVGECLCGLAVSEGEPIYSDDIYRDPRCTWEECRAAKLKSFAALPLKTRDGIIGVLGLASATGGDFSKQSYFLETLAYQLAVCLGNAVMHERLQQQAEQLQNMVDELKHANETTGRTAATLNSTLRAAPVGIGLVDSERKLGWINDALAKMMGCSQEELSGQRARILYPDDEEFERVARIKHPQVREKGFGSLETRFKRKDGQVIDVLLSSVAIDPTDQNSALVFTALDISERKRKDALLQERKHFLRRILNTEPGTVYIYDLVERRNVYINRPWLPEFGYTPEEKAALGEDIHGRLFHPDDRALIEAHHQAWRRAGEGQTREIEYRIRTKDGQWRWLRSRETAFARDDAGLVSQILGVALDITKQKLAEEELRRSEDRYRDLYETAPIAYFSMSAVDGSILRCNPAVLKILGYDKDTLMKMRVLDLYADTSEGIAKAKEVFSRFRKGESIRDVSLEMKHKDGQSVWISLSVNPVTNGEGEVIESRSAIIDITERKRAEEALKENDRWLRTILDSIQAAVVVHGPDTRIVLVNPKAQEFLGQTEKLLVGKDARDPEWSFMREDGRPLAIDEYPVNLVLAKSQPLRGFVGGIARPDEQGTKWVTLNADPVLDDQGNISQVIVTFMDITDRKKAEDELRVEKERFQVLNDESPLGISLIGPDGRYEYVNPRFVRMFGYDLDDIPEGREWFRRAYPDSDYRRQVVSAWLEDRERAVVGEARPRTFTVTCKDGSEKETHFRPVSLEDGSQLVIYEDITERIKAERELRELEEQLRQSQKMEAIGTLAGGVAHDFNNLMTAVTGFSEFALESLDPNHPAYRDIEEVKKAGERATSLTRQLLAFSRKQILEPKVVDLNEMVINM